MASYEGTAELEALLNTSTLGNDLKAFFESPQKVLSPAVELCGTEREFVPDLPSFVPSHAIGLKPRIKPSFFREAAGDIIIDFSPDPVGLQLSRLATGLQLSFSGRTQVMLADALSSISSAATRLTEQWSQSFVDADPSHSQFNMIDSTRCDEACSLTCSTVGCSHTDTSTLCGSSSDVQFGHQLQSAFLSSKSIGMPTVDQIQGQIKSNTLPIFRAPIDSGCTATCTDTLEHLVNVRPCNETYDAATGEKAKCTMMGDMPVLAKDSTGKIFRFVFTNVRYVPDFKYTLLSVKQCKREQGIKRPPSTIRRS